MSSLHRVSPITSKSVLRKEANHRKQYRKPELEELGDLRTLTLGGSPGTGDSGSFMTRFPPGGDDFLQPGGFPPLE